MTPLDWSIVLLYTAVILAIGNHMRKRIRSAGAFLLGERKLGTPMMIASTFAGGVNANNPISVASNTYTSGLSGMWLSLAFVLATPIYWMWPPVLRRLRVVTLIDFLRMRFGRGMEWVQMVSYLVVVPFTFGVGMKAAAMLVIAVAGPGADGSPAFGIHTALALVVLPTLVYTLLGGIVGAYAVDMFQSVLLVFLSFVLLPFMVWTVGGLPEVVARIDAHNPAAWNLLGDSHGVSGLWLLWFTLSLFISAPVVYGGSSGAARNEMAARWAVIGSLGKRFCTIGWGLTGLFAVALFGAPLVSGVKADDVFSLAAVHTLPAGLRGLMVASMLAAAMSTLAGMMLYCSSCLVNNLYKDYLVREASPRHYLLMARVFLVVPILLGWTVAASGLSLVHLVVIVEQISSLMGVCMVAALVWRRVTAAGAVVSICLMSPLFYYGNLQASAWPQGYRWLAERVLDLYRLAGVEPRLEPARLESIRPDLLLPLTTPIYLGTGVLVLILVSLFTRQHDRHAVAEFYARLETPLGDERKLREAGFTADTVESMDQVELNAAAEDRDRSRRLLLLDFLTWPWLVLTRRARLSDYWIDFAGIAGSFLFIAGLLTLIGLLRPLLH
ncbi:MAG: hypothetical protein FJ399_17915 [Verrucomicrobia bacterium]|nr:hypothetical protein [Verrucomicrobiota bacterium]